jgi:hypothetical protein
LSYAGHLADRRLGFRTLSPPPHAAREARHAVKHLDVHGGWERKAIVQGATRVEEDVDIAALRTARGRSCHCHISGQLVMRPACQLVNPTVEGFLISQTEMVRKIPLQGWDFRGRGWVASRERGIGGFSM